MAEFKKQLANHLLFKDIDDVGVIIRSKFESFGDGTFRKIKDVYSDVTLSDVQALDSTATLDNSADWFVLQSMLVSSHQNNKKRINLPQGVFVIDKTLNFKSIIENTEIRGKGTRINANTGFTGYLINFENLVGQYTYSRRIRLDGIMLDGKFTAKGVNMGLNANENYLHNVLIQNCEIGLNYSGVYYGEVSGETIFQNCLTAIRFVSSTSNEVNTIKFLNTKINFGTQKSNFINVTNPITKAVDIDCQLYNIVFDGATIEAYDYGFYGFAGETVSNTGTFGGIFEIDNVYLELVTNPIFLKTINNVKRFHVNVSIANARIFACGDVQIGQGQYSIFNTRLSSSKIIVDNTDESASLHQLDTDVSMKDIIVKNDKLSNVIIYNKAQNPAVNSSRFDNYGTTSSVFNQQNSLGSIQHDEQLISRRGIGTVDSTTPFLGKKMNVRTLNTFPVTFKNPTGGFAAPVLEENGKYYMQVVENAQLILKEVTNLYRLEEPYNSMTAKELWLKEKVEDEIIFCIDLQRYVQCKSGKWVDPTTTTRLLIGQTSDFLGATTTTYGSGYHAPTVWNVQINNAYRWFGNKFVWGDNWFGKYNTTWTFNVIGPLSNRPTTPSENVIYFSTDDNTYTRFNGVSWVAYTPLF